MRIMLVTWLLVAGFCGVARAEVYEIPLPVTGDYGLGELREFSIDLGFPLADVHSVQFRAEGTIVAPLASDRIGDPYDRPINGIFNAGLRRSDISNIIASAPDAGKATYPEPEPFSGVGSFADHNWAFLLDGSVDGYVYFAHGDWITGQAVGGQGVLNSAALIVNATPVPEPSAMLLLSLTPYLFLRRVR